MDFKLKTEKLELSWILVPNRKIKQISKFINIRIIQIANIPIKNQLVESSTFSWQ